jgi:hypothetical protein
VTEKNFSPRYGFWNGMSPSPMRGFAERNTEALTEAPLMNVRLQLLAAVCWLSLTLPLKASITYDYTGNPFTTFTGSTGLSVANFVSASITLPSALPASMSFTDVAGSIEGWSMTDGVHTLDSSNSILVFANFSTDAGGSIDEWRMGAFELDELLATGNCPSNGCGTVIDLYSMGEIPFFDDAMAQVISNPGVWMAAPTAVPEPSTFGCAISAGALWVLWSRRRRSSEISVQREG